MNKKISVIIPTYNSEQYLQEAIESVLDQSIGFQNNIQLILINDGSTDDSEEICLKYQQKYPNNIIYKKQKNQGVSAARNSGLKIAKGEYIHFLDSDDLISKDFYKQSIEFLDKNKNVDIVASKIKFFDKIIDSHSLNYKFYKTQIISLDNSPNNPLLHLGTCLFRRESICAVSFDERLKVSEDLKFLSEVLAAKRSYGVLKSPTYFYRKRQDESSAIGGKLRDRSYYLKTPKLVYENMINQWTYNKKIHKFIQHTLLYDLSYRLSQESQSVLSRKEELEYKSTIKNIIKKIDDEIILSRKDYDVHLKAYLLRIKYGKEFDELISFNGGRYLFRGNNLANVDSSMIHLDFLHSESKGRYKLEGYVEGLLRINDLTLIFNGRKILLKPTEREQRRRSFLGDEIFDGGSFEGSIQPKNKNSQTLRAQLKNSKYQVKIRTGRFTRLSNLNGSYRKDDRLLIQKSKNKLSFYKKSNLKIVFFEILYLTRILFDWRLDRAISQFKKLLHRNLKQLSFRAKVFEVSKPSLFIIEAIVMIPRAWLLRLSYYFIRIFKKNELWLMSDRGMAAGDNGEALFRYIQKQDNEKMDAYFVISKKSPDYGGVKKIGPILNQGSLRYKLKFLLADKIISSHADIEITNPFFRQLDHFVDLLGFDFIFLQHGVTKHDVSGWLNRFEKNISLFVTSAKKEYNSILNYPYYYSEEKVVLSGFPRFDFLTNNPKEKLIIMPTYRADLLRTKTDKNGSRPYDSEFKKSKYYKFYNSLINDRRLIKSMKESGIKGELYLHPNFAEQAGDFEVSDSFSIPTYPYNYQLAFEQGSLLVTDYSSVAFDFAYLKKPIVYAKFDEGSFYEGHSYRRGSFFIDKLDGFGPVVNNYEALVSSLAGIIKEGCIMGDEYRKRADEFFFVIDRNNSKRVYDAIMEMDK